MFRLREDTATAPGIYDSPLPFPINFERPVDCQSERKTYVQRSEQAASRRVLTLIDDVAEMARELINLQPEPFAPLAFVGKTTTSTICPLHPKSMRAGEPITDFVCRSASECNADFSLMLVAERDDPDAVLSIVVQPHEPTDGVIAVGFVLETYAGVWTARVPVKLSEGTKTIKQVRMRMAGAKSFGFLPQR